MENLEEIEKYSLDDFRAEIAEIAKKEAESGETADFSGIILHPEELTDEDKLVWVKLNNGSLELEDFKQYRTSFGGFESETRERFLYYLANKLNVHNNGK